MKTKTIFVLALIAILTLSLSACRKADSTSQAQNTDSSQSGTPNGTPIPGDFGNGELPQVTKLAIGTLMLEDTDQAVTPDQATNLLNLWQAYQALSTSDTAATQEVDAVVKQIQSAMTSEQLQAIDDMQLTGQSMRDVMQNLGIDFGLNSNAQGTPQANGQRNSNRGNFSEGDMPPGGFDGGQGFGPGGGQGFAPDGGFNGGTPDPELQATRQARFGGMSNSVNPMLLQALIEMLESK